MYKETGNAAQGRTGRREGEWEGALSSGRLFTCCCRRAWLAVGKLDGLRTLT